MKIQAYQCDECGVQKQQSNHWVIACQNAGGLNFWPWSDDMAKAPQAIHLCGAGCAGKVLSKSIHEWSER